MASEDISTSTRERGERTLPDEGGEAGIAALNQLSAALDRLNQVRIGPMSSDQATSAAGMLGSIRSMVSSLLCDVAHQIEADSESEVDPGEVLRREARLPYWESKKITKVARRLQTMPAIKERFADGSLTPGEVDALVNAADKVGPEVVNSDQSLLEAADRMLPDSFNRHVRRWSNQKLIEAGLDPFERQLRTREAKMWVEKDTDLGVILAKLPRPQFEQVRQAIDKRFLHHIRHGNGNGLSPGEERTPQQVLADVVYELLTNRDASTGQPLAPDSGIKAKASVQLILTAPFGTIDGTDPRGQVEMIGVGPVPRSILRTLSPDTALAGMVFDRSGRPLWLGRNRRLANAAQRLAVAIRDGGCYECGAPMHRCDLHHIAEWHRDGGRTDVDNLVAICRPHHKFLEANNLRIQRTPNGYQTHPRQDRAPP